MARSRRRARGTLKRPATAFAGGSTGTGKSVGWESILNDEEPQQIDSLLPTLVRTSAGNIQTRARSLLPINVTRGIVTMLRVRGTIAVYFDTNELSTSLANWAVHFSIQLVPARNGVFQTAAILTPSNSADQESNRIVWQHMYYPQSGGTITIPGDIEFHDTWHTDVDVKVKRRFDRAVWDLMLVADVEAGAALRHLSCGYLRALFATADGL